MIRARFVFAERPAGYSPVSGVHVTDAGGCPLPVATVTRTVVVPTVTQADAGTLAPLRRTSRMVGCSSGVMCEDGVEIPGVNRCCPSLDEIADLLFVSGRRHPALLL